MPGGSYPPPEVIASWPKPNYVDPEIRGPALYITCATLSAVGIIVVAARLYARLVITKAPGLDDAIIVVALLLGIGSSVLSIYGTEALYVGYHVWDIPPSAYVALRLNAWLSQWFTTGVLSAVKISLLLFYRRLSVTFSNVFLWATYVGIGYNIVYFLVVAFSISFECRPTASYWLAYDAKWLAEGHTYSCSHIEGVILPTYSALSVIGDFYSTTLPLCLVYSLQMGPRQKASLYCLFGVGYLVVAAGIARTVFVNEVVNKTYDTSWRFYDALLWVTVEFYVAIICASAPGLKPFVKKFLVEPMTQDPSSRKQRRSGYTFGSSGKRYFRNPSDAYLNDANYDEESWVRGGVEVELSKVDTQRKGEKMGVTVYETREFFSEPLGHSLTPTQDRADIGRYPRSQRSPIEDQYEQDQMAHQNISNQHVQHHLRTPSQSTIRNTAHRHSHNSEEPILEPPQTLDDRIYAHPGQVVPFKLHLPPQVPSQRQSRDPSFVTISAFPLPRPRAPSRVSETDERVTADKDYDFELPLQGTRENSPTDMTPVRATRHHVRSKSKAS